MSNQPKDRALFAGLIVAIGLAVFWPALSGKFVYDDLLMVLQNPRVQGSVPLTDGLMGSFWGFDGEGAEGRVGYWRPMSFLSLRLCAWLGGGATTFHLFSLGLHIAAALVAWRLGARLLRSEALGFGAALLFLVHPVQVEGVSWISSISDPLQGLFALAALHGVLRWRGAGSKGWPIAATLCFAIALGAKEQALTLLPAALLIDWCAARLGNHERRNSVRLYGPLALVLVGYYFARVAVFGDALAGFDRQNTDLDMGLARGLSFRFELLGGFLSLLAAPLELNTFRPFRPVFDPASSAFIQALIAVPIWAALVLAALRKRAHVPLGMLLLIPICLSPILVNSDAAGEFPLSERYLYMPAFAFAIGFAWLASRLFKSRAQVALCAIAILFAIQSSARTQVWQNESNLFRAAVAASPQSPFVHWSLGRVLLTEHTRNPSEETLLAARDAFTTSLALGTGPDAASIWVSSEDRVQANLGLSFARLYLSEYPGYQLADAEAAFALVADNLPDNPQAWLGRGMCAAKRAADQRAAGNILAADTASKDALAHLQQAIALDPAMADAWSTRAEILASMNQWQLAGQSFEMALAARPGDTALALASVRCQIESGQLDNAAERLDRLREQAPNNNEATLVAALLATRRGQFQTALTLLDQVIDHDPDHGEAWINRGKVLLNTNQNQLAQLAFERAVELRPRSFEAQYNLAGLLLQSNPPAATGALVAAYQLAPAGQYRQLLQQQLSLLTVRDFELALSLARADQARGARAEALGFARQAAALKPSDDQAASLVKALQSPL